MHDAAQGCSSHADAGQLRARVECPLYAERLVHLLKLHACLQLEARHFHSDLTIFQSGIERSRVGSYFGKRLVGHATALGKHERDSVRSVAERQFGNLRSAEFRVTAIHFAIHERHGGSGEIRVREHVVLRVLHVELFSPFRFEIQRVGYDERFYLIGIHELGDHAACGVFHPPVHGIGGGRFVLHIVGAHYCAIVVGKRGAEAGIGNNGVVVPKRICHCHTGALVRHGKCVVQLAVKRVQIGKRSVGTQHREHFSKGFTGGAVGSHGESHLSAQRRERHVLRLLVQLVEHAVGQRIRARSRSCLAGAHLHPHGRSILRFRTVVRAAGYCHSHSCKHSKMFHIFIGPD